MANFEYVKNMTVEEMATLLENIIENIDDDLCKCDICAATNCFDGCTNGIRKFLESERKEND